MSKDLLKELEKNMRGLTKEELKEQTKGSKELYELVFEEKFNVDKVLTESKEISAPSGEIIIGGKNPYHTSGMSLRMILDVTPEKDIPVRNLNFIGFSPIRAEDLILAKIPKYEKKSFRVAGHRTVYDNGTRLFYFDREYNHVENVIELTILSPNGKPIRTDRAVNYGGFFKE